MTLKTTKLKKIITGTLEDHKAEDCAILDIRKLTDIADFMIVASGNSERHLKSMSDKVVEAAKKNGFMPSSVSGDRNSDWLLIDFGSIIVHLMLNEARKLYKLEDLWKVCPAKKSSS